MKLLLFISLMFSTLTLQINAVPSLSSSQEIHPHKESFFLPIKQQLLKWHMIINREVPKKMKALKDNPSPTVILTSILASFIYGILHTLGPGHGKTVVASYFLTNDARFWRGAFIGIQVAFVHVAGAIVLIFATDIAMHHILTNTQDQILWIRIISYSLISFIGLFIMLQTLKDIFKHKNNSQNHYNGSYHNHETKKDFLISWCVGAVPCTGSILILLYAIAHNIMWIGLSMLLFVALGMALTITSVGWLCILGKKKLLDRFFNKNNSFYKWQLGLKMLGAIVITFIGTTLLSTILF